MAQTQQIRMSLMFDADTSRAKASLKDLQNSLNGLTKNIESGDFPMTGKIQEAYVAAEKLKRILNASVNMSTGQFDLSKFNAQLKQGGLSAQELGQKFAGAGAAGAQAFAQLATTIANAEIPTKRMSHLVENMARSLKQTMQWQISSSMVHGFTGALQSAYGYAKDLNRSLNDIRIVTGENIEFMERYATQANRAAKALSTTTNEYAKASLIFYQQGLDDDAVSRRTAAAVKMANVTGESAQDISSYMTAIWNNFDNGTKSLEYYADAITALGAATASSTEEIAGGMQQFASVAETVGLSYEYAASALATVVSATRQSEDTVGTSFKTIFARLSSLQLGETLEDGVTLTKYSQALGAVGINIMDANGQLKSMDQILDELGNKWRTISREQQNALAYTVAGTRQYNNFISLLDNYETFKINVDLAIDSEGTLEEQQKIYAESWQAAARKAKAAAESIYEKLLDDDFFITMLNGLEKFLSGLDKFIDAIGGLPGVLSLVSTLMLRIFSAQAAESVRNMAYGFKSLTGVAKVEAGATKSEFLKAARSSINSARSDVDVDLALNAELDALQKRTELEQIYLQYEDKLSQKQKDEFNLQLQLLDILRQQNKEKAKAVEQSEQQVNKSGYQIMATATNVSGFRENKEKAWKQKHGEALASKAGEKTRVDQNLEQIRALEIQTQNEITNLENGEYRKALAQRTAFTSKVTTLSNTEGVKKQDLDNAKAERDIADGIVKIIEQELGENRQLLDEIRAERANLEQQQIQLKTTIEQLMNEKFTGADNYQDASNAGSLLQKYTTYTAGQDTIIQDSFENLFKPFDEGTAAGEVIDAEAKQELVSELKQFAENYAVKLGEETAERLTAIIDELDASKNVDVETLNKFKSEYQKANEQDRNKYKKSGAQEIRAALEEEHGILIEDKPFEEYSAGLQQLTDDVKNYTAANHNSQKVQNQVAEGLRNNAENALPDAAKSFVNLFTGITSATTALMTLKGVFDVWNNEDMSIGDKLLSTFMSLTSAIGSAISAFDALRQVQLLDMVDSIKRTASIWAENAARKISTALKLEETAVTYTKTGADSAETAGVWAKVAAYIAAQLAAAPLLVVTIAIAAAMALLVGAVILLVGAFKEIEKNSPAGQLRQAKEEAKFFEEALKDAKAQADQLKESFDKYKEIQDKLSNCTRGTEEWTAALQENNEQVIALMQAYPQLASMINSVTGETAIGRNSITGALEIRDWAMEELQNMLNSSILVNMGASYSANAQVREKESNKVKNKIQRNLYDDIAGRFTTTGEYDNIVDIGGQILQQTVMPNLEAFAGLTKEEINNKITSLDMDRAQQLTNDQLDKLSELIYNAQGDIQTWNNSIVANTQAAKAETEALKAALLNNNEEIANSKYRDQVIASTSTWDDETLESRVQAEIATLKEQGWGTKSISQADKVNDEAEIRFKEYAEAAGLTGVTLVDTTGSDTNRKFVYEDAQGDSKSVSLDTMLRVIATKKAEGDIQTEASELMKLYENKNKGTVDLLTTIASGSADFMSRSQIQSFTYEDGQYFNTKARDAIFDIIGVDDQMIKTILGSDATLKDFEERFEIAIMEAQKAWKINLAKMSETTQQSLNNLIAQFGNNPELQRLTDTELVQYGTALERIYQTNGATAQQSLTGVLDTLIEENASEADKIVQIAGQIDWTNGEKGLIQLQNQLADNGIEINKNTDAWRNLVTAISNTPLSPLQYDFKLIREEIATIQDLVQDISFGDVITDDDFETLKQYSAEIRDMFILTADGYRFIGDAAKLTKATLDQSRTILKEGLNTSDIVEDMMPDLDHYTKSYAAPNATTFVNELMSDQSMTDEVFTQLEFAGGKERLKELQDIIMDSSRSSAERDGAFAEIQRLYNNMSTLQERYRNGDFETANDYDLYASQFNSIEALNKEYKTFLKDEGLWSDEALAAYNKQRKYLNDLNYESIDIYQDEEIAIGKINKQLAENQKLKEKTPGQAHLDALVEEADLYGDLIVENRRNMSQARQRRNKGSREINKLLDAQNSNVEIKKDESGKITNWEELDKALGVNNEDYLKWKKWYQQYESDMEAYGEAAKEAGEKQRTVWLESATYVQAFNEEIRELELGWLEYQFDKLADKAFAANEVLSILTQQLALYRSNTDDLMSSLNNIANEFGVSPQAANESTEDFIARLIASAPEAREKIEDVGASLLTSMQNYNDLSAQIDATIEKQFQDTAEYYDNISEKFNNLSSSISHYRDLISLVGKDTLGINEETAASLNTMEQSIANASLSTAKAKYDAFAADRKTAEEELAKARAEGNEANIALWEKELKTATEMEQGALEEMNGAWSTALETATSILQDNTATIMESFSDSMAGLYGSFDHLSKVFGQKSQISNQYLADYKKLYELSKLQRNIQLELDNPEKSLAAKESLRQLQAEITSLQREGVQMSQYDMDYLQKKYDLRVAEIALEEAQNAKSQVRLRKMSDGSWGYVYTQNADAVAQAQQNYEDKLYSLQELSTNYLDSTSEQIISTQAEFQQAISEIMNSGLSEEEKRQQVEETVEFYKQRLEFLTSEFDEVIQNNQGLNNLVQSFSDTLLGTLYGDEYDSADDIFTRFTTNLGSWEDGSGTLGQLKTALETFSGSISNIFSLAGLNISTFGSSISDTYKALFGEGDTKGLITKLMEDVENPELQGLNSIANEMSEKKSEIATTLSEIEDEYDAFLTYMANSKLMGTTGLTRGQMIERMTSVGYGVAGGWEGQTDQQIMDLYSLYAMNYGSSFATGGYTGEWGSSGKLAVLHEKEIVLNQQDTQNLLHIMEIMDRVIKNIDVSAAAASIARLSPGTVTTSENTLQQEVTIHAEFPNATNHSEIEEAFNSLINRASQYTNRNR